MRFRFPDRPKHIYSLKMVKEGEYLSQTKYDGHFAVIIQDAGLMVMSRHQKPLPISAGMLDALKTMAIPNGTVLHGEWTSRREANRNEAIYLFSVAYENYEWLGQLGEEERYKRLGRLNPTSNILVVESRTTGYAAHYKETVDDWKTEGIVLKRRNAKLLGDLREPRDNPGFLKLKWREGADGMVKTVVPDSDLVME